MKLIIDIPDHLYTVIKNKECTHKNVLTEAVYDGTPLDKIRTKIEQAKFCKVKTNNGKEIIASADFVIHPDKRSYTNGLDMALQIINKYAGEKK